jgi:hypothetical protein
MLLLPSTPFLYVPYCVSVCHVFLGCCCTRYSHGGDGANAVRALLVLAAVVTALWLSLCCCPCFGPLRSRYPCCRLLCGCCVCPCDKRRAGWLSGGKEGPQTLGEDTAALLASSRHSNRTPGGTTGGGDPSVLGGPPTTPRASSRARTSAVVGVEDRVPGEEAAHLLTPAINQAASASATSAAAASPRPPRHVASPAAITIAVHVEDDPSAQQQTSTPVALTSG